ncbi:MAG: helix-hairpin-helix domain-containing protein [Oscillospiraceae bacterium]|nr:helix-hairpin-helix domain-containing protein [Oscillospiraceae bacterium]
MDSQRKQIRFLVVVALILCSATVFYNAFFAPKTDMEEIIYIDGKNTEELYECNSEQKKDLEFESEEKININLSSVEDLSENLPGIGRSIAERIVKKREEFGLFLDINDIKNVSGVGEKKFEKIKDFICV